ncbi:hypothetical protein GNY06_00795, partial [Elizabethkingia argentiflava]|nr:hypothetical protein [Elizabethkingia argenteiflava]
LSAFFEYDEVVRKSIYTTNPIQGVHRQIRKITKTKGAFPSEQPLMKLMYLVYRISVKNGQCLYITGVSHYHNFMLNLEREFSRKKTAFEEH